MPNTEIYTQHTQIMAVLSGAIYGEEARQLMERALSECIHRVTLPFSYLLFQALKTTGLQNRAFEVWDRWRLFISQGLTTLPEKEVNLRSDCHAWCAVPLAEFPSTILGVTPAEPGYGEIAIKPHPGNLTWAAGSIATPHGMVEVEWRLEERQFKLRAKVPNGVVGRIMLPDGSEHTIHGEGRFQSAVPDQ